MPAAVFQHETNLRSLNWLQTWLENLIQPMLKDRTIGICASKLIFENPQTVNSAGDGLTPAGVGFNRGLGQDAAQFDTSEPVFGACGAAALYRRRVLDEIAFWMRISFFTMRTRISIFVLNWLVGSVSMSLPQLSTTWPMRWLGG
jgi:hypothetical protein